MLRVCKTVLQQRVAMFRSGGGLAPLHAFRTAGVVPRAETEQETSPGVGEHVFKPSENEPPVSHPVAVRFGETGEQRAVSRPGMLLVGHGSRDLLGQQAFLDLAARVAERLPEIPVAAGFLELCPPTLADAWQSLRDQGVREVRAVPAILFAAGHAKQDIPEALEAAAGCPVRLAAHLGLHSAVVERSKQISDRLLARCQPLPAARQGLLLVGRGSSDPSATAEMLAFQQQRAQPERFAVQSLAFVAKAQPCVAEQLERLGQLDLERIVVQPHLLFGGRVYDEVAEQVVQASFRFSHQQWLLTPPLGPDALVAEAIVDRFTQVV